MPITPYHGGFGLITKGIFLRGFSLLGFCAGQVAVDLESGYYLLRDEWPYHRSLHTFLGATIMCTIAIALCRRVAIRRRWSFGNIPIFSRLLEQDLDVLRSRSGTVATIFLAVVGHVVPDGIMHSDVRPFAPLTDYNPFHGLVSWATLHLSLVVVGGIGAVAILVRWWMEEERGPASSRATSRSRRTFLVALMLGSTLASCSGPYVRKYEHAVADNRRRFQELRLKMSRAQVDEVMGVGDLVRYKKIHLANPWRSEAATMRDGTNVTVLYYVTDGYQWHAWSEQRVLTPVVLENDRVVGWGWEYLERNHARYFAPDPSAR